MAHDYGFTGPDRIPTGVTTMQVVNQGQDLHHIQVVKLLRGKTAADFSAALKADPSRLPQWAKLMGGPNAVVLGSSQSVATMNLVEGNYMLTCIIPDKAGVLHMALGMQKELSVKGGKSSLVSESKAGTTITLRDFQFALSQPITADLHTIGVMNHGTQPHEVVVVQLAPGASALDFVKAVEPGGFRVSSREADWGSGRDRNGGPCLPHGTVRTGPLRADLLFSTMRRPASHTLHEE